MPVPQHARSECQAPWRDRQSLSSSASLLDKSCGPERSSGCRTVRPGSVASAAGRKCAGSCWTRLAGCKAENLQAGSELTKESGAVNMFFFFFFFFFSVGLCFQINPCGLVHSHVPRQPWLKALQGRQFASNTRRLFLTHNLPHS